MRRWGGIGIALLTLLAGGLSLAHAQQPPPSGPQATLGRIRDGTFPNATAPVYIDDPSGAELAGLKASDFSVTVDGKPAAVLSADLASSKALPLDVLLLVDVSGSMGGKAIANVRQSATAFVASLAPDDRVAITTFSDNVTPVVDFTTDRRQIQAAIDSLAAGGNTALYQATSSAAQKIAASPANRRAVILLSDGAQDGVPATVSRDDALKAALYSDVPWFTIGEGSDIDRAYLQGLAIFTRGRYLEAPQPSDLTAVVSDVGRLLRDQYAVTFDASAANHSGSTVVLTVHAGSAVASATATYMPGPGFVPPQLVVAGVRAGDQVSRATSITVTGGVPAGGVTFYVDGIDVQQATSPPYAFTFDPARYAPGAHTLRIAASASAPPVETTVAFSSVRPAANGGGLPLMPIAAVAAAVVLIAVVAMVILRLRSMPQNAPDVNVARVIPFAPRGGDVEAQEAGADATPAPESIGEPMGVLVSRGGADLGAEYPVGGRPVSIGSASTCGVRVDDPELSGEEARIWINKGRLMLHRMTRLSAMMVDGSSGGWQIFDPGESFEVGGHRFEFQLLPPPRPERAPGEIPNVLRDPEPSRSQVVPPPPATGPMPMPEARHSNFSDLMPRSD